MLVENEHALKGDSLQGLKQFTKNIRRVDRQQSNESKIYMSHICRQTCTFK
jgi:hypothetical protein